MLWISRLKPRVKQWPIRSLTNLRTRFVLINPPLSFLQPPQTILAQLELQRKIPIHTISFNCDDTGANKFLHQLANETGGRFHYYHICLMDPDAPKPFEASLEKLKREKNLF